MLIEHLQACKDSLGGKRRQHRKMALLVYLWWVYSRTWKIPEVTSLMGRQL